MYIHVTVHVIDELFRPTLSNQYFVQHAVLRSEPDGGHIDDNDKEVPKVIKILNIKYIYHTCKQIK